MLRGLRKREMRKLSRLLLYSLIHQDEWRSRFSTTYQSWSTKKKNTVTAASITPLQAWIRTSLIWWSPSNLTPLTMTRPKTFLSLASTLLKKRIKSSTSWPKKTKILSSLRNIRRKERLKNWKKSLTLTRYFSMRTRSRIQMSRWNSLVGFLRRCHAWEASLTRFRGKISEVSSNLSESGLLRGEKFSIRMVITRSDHSSY